MPSSDDPQGEQPGPYFVPDPTNDDERIRLHIQDRMLTTSMGGVLPEQEDLSRFHRVLDVGCGTGSWLIEAAKTYSHIELLVGMDVSDRLVQHACEQVSLHGLDKERVQFATMDVLHVIEAPIHFFDLVNQRSSVSWLHTCEWPKLLREYKCIARPGGIVRITEPELAPKCSSEAFTRLFDLLLKAFYQAGHLFAPESDGLTSRLPHLLHNLGFGQVQTRTYTTEIDYRASSTEAQQGREDLRYLFRTIRPFLQRWTNVPTNYASLYQQAMRDIQQPDFRLTSRIVTVWAVMNG